MKKVFMLLCAVIPFIMMAKEPIIIPLYPESESKNMSEVPMIYFYPAEKPNGLCIIDCPGGAYAMRAIDHEGHAYAQWLNDQGVSFGVLQYRMPEHNSTVPGDDARNAIKKIRKQADKYGIKKVGIMGFSAGGHLASTVATHYDAESRPDFQILFYPVITMDEKLTHQGTRNNLLPVEQTEEDVILYSNELQVNAQTPPALVFHSFDDGAVPVENAINYCMALKRNNVPAYLHIFPNGGHGWGFNDSFDQKPLWQFEMANFLQRMAE